MSRFYAIKPNHGTEIPTSHIFFDTETYPTGDLTLEGRQVLRLRVGCASYVRLERLKITRELHCSFTDSKRFWDLVREQQDPRKPLWVWAHNLGFDLTIAEWWKELEEERYIVGELLPSSGDDRLRGDKAFHGLMCLSGRPTFAVTMGERGKVIFNDLANYLTYNLDSIGVSLGLPKYGMPEQDAPLIQWIAYCQQDVLILKTAVLRLLESWADEDCGVFRTTAGALAMTNWRHTAEQTKEGRHKWEVTPIRDTEPDLLEREAYMGGWVECFYHGKVRGEIHHLDIQSCYPAVMKNNTFPAKRIGYWRAASHGMFAALASDGNAIARVLISSGSDLYPVRHKGQLCMCKGDFWTTLCGPELQRAWNRGHIRAIGECARYEMSPLFDTFVSYWWERRKLAIEAGDDFDESFCKMMLTSLSGKWGQCGRQWRDAPYLTAEQDWGQYTTRVEANGPLLKCRAIAGNVQVEHDDGPPDWAMPCISAFICSYAREMMQACVRRAGERSVYHVSTDSILCNTLAFAELCDSGWVEESCLGKLSVKGVYSGGEFHGQNDYRIGDKVVAAGSWGRAKEVVSGQWVWDQFQGLPSIIAERPDGSVRVERIDLSRGPVTNKGVFRGDGWSEPYTLKLNGKPFIPIYHPELRWDMNDQDSA
jgi:DNA polymerase type B, organellar and viral